VKAEVVAAPVELDPAWELALAEALVVTTAVVEAEPLALPLVTEAEEEA